MNEKDARIEYADIIDRDPPVSRNHPRMAAINRAAQFAPFAALTGYDEMINESFERSEEDLEFPEINIL